MAEQSAQRARLVSARRAKETSKYRLVIGSLTENLVHEFGNVIFTRRCRPVTVWTDIALSLNKMLGFKTRQHGMNGRQRQIAVGERFTQIGGRQRCSIVPELVHDGSFKLTEGFHDCLAPRLGRGLMAVIHRQPFYDK
ncbi:hypothetical protein BJY26_002462 [Spelaeicoccus albus]|uniref:Uncharacterized protein n=1 Tax=Spelaeicoccus albus TaxID=1280376 RepID=A0A7Z0D3E9_9MICO|nr:hypothetical protein [Spelaeicoccus albus]